LRCDRTTTARAEQRCARRGVVDFVFLLIEHDRFGKPDHAPGEKVMHRMGFAALAAASILSLWTAASPALALAHSHDYCLLGRIWGYPGSCEFSTFRECLASSSETGFGCVVNPRYALATRPRHHRR
jgi:hypothetical protein